MFMNDYSTSNIQPGELRDLPTSHPFICKLWLLKSTTPRLRSCIGRIWHTSLLASTTNWRHPAYALLGVQLDRRSSTFNHAGVVHDTDLDDSRIAEGLTLSPEGGAAVTAEAVIQVNN